MNLIPTLCCGNKIISPALILNLAADITHSVSEKITVCCEALITTVMDISARNKIIGLKPILRHLGCSRVVLASLLLFGRGWEMGDWGSAHQQ